MRRTGWLAGALAAAVAVAIGVIGIVMFVRSAPGPAGASGSLSRTQLIRLTERVRCPTPPAVLAAAPRAAGFRAVAVVLCDPVLVPGSARFVRRATGSAVPALQRLVLTGRRGTTAQCFADSLLPTTRVVLVDATGRLWPVSLSRDSCGLPDPVVLAALGRRPWIRLPG